MSEKTEVKRTKGGRWAKGSSGSKSTQFNKDRQPPPESKRIGWSKKRMLKELLELSPKALFAGSQTDYVKIAAEYFGIEEKDVTIKLIMAYRQIEKAIKGGDTMAYIAISDRAFGRPKQEIDANITANQEVTLTIGKKRINKE